eukprot:COSAG02_NODE_638_length_19141_cov_20.963449_8_plen_54_part_00
MCDRVARAGVAIEAAAEAAAAAAAALWLLAGDACEPAESSHSVIRILVHHGRR